MIQTIYFMAPDHIFDVLSLWNNFLDHPWICCEMAQTISHMPQSCARPYFWCSGLWKKFPRSSLDMLWNGPDYFSYATILLQIRFLMFWSMKQFPRYSCPGYAVKMAQTISHMPQILLQIIFLMFWSMKQFPRSSLDMLRNGPDYFTICHNLAPDRIFDVLVYETISYDYWRICCEMAQTISHMPQSCSRPYFWCPGLYTDAEDNLSDNSWICCEMTHTEPSQFL